jgi:hypothetical protein
VSLPPTQGRSETLTARLREVCFAQLAGPSVPLLGSARSEGQAVYATVHVPLMCLEVLEQHAATQQRPSLVLLLGRDGEHALIITEMLQPSIFRETSGAYGFDNLAAALQHVSDKGAELP